MDILKKFNIKSDNIDLYLQAFTHTSYANENGCISYERLEYLGDAIFDFLIGEYLYLNTDYKEGQMTKVRAQYVCEDALFMYSNYLGFNECLRLGIGEEETGGRKKKAIIADIFESFLGAMYLDLGFDFVKSFVYEYVIPLILNSEFEFLCDYKSRLQEYVQTDKRTLSYVVIKEEGPSHDKTFTINVMINDIIYGTGVAKTKKEAEQNAAKDALLKARGGN